MSSSKTPTTVTNETDFSQLSLPTTPQLAIRTYKISSASSWTRRFKITTTTPASTPDDKSTETILYHLTFTSSIKDFSMILHTGPPKSKNPTVVAGSKVSVYKNTTVLSLGSSASGDAKLFDMKINSAWKHNSYDLPFQMPDGKVLQLQWKGTNEVQGFMKKMDRGMHHKLVESVGDDGGKGSGRLLARYVHNSWSLDVPGDVEIIAVPEGVVDLQGWDLFVLLGAMAVAEKTLKTVSTVVGAVS